MKTQAQDGWMQVVASSPIFQNIASDFDGPPDRELEQLADGRYEVRHIDFTGERHPFGIAPNWWAAVRMAA